MTAGDDDLMLQHTCIRICCRWAMALCMLCCTAHATAQTSAQVNTSDTPLAFYGFMVDLSRLNQQQQIFIAPVLLAQLEVILKADLPPIMLTFMKTVPVVVDPGLPVSGTAALFSTAHAYPRGVVKTSLVPMPAEKPVLLHEMLHAYDWSYWRFANAEIQSAYSQASNASLYPQWQGSHFMQNAREFFAVTGTVYLVGQIKQPPFDCQSLANLQPAYVMFMQKLFGQHTHCDQVQLR
jgi:hypothetical protein